MKRLRTKIVAVALTAFGLCGVVVAVVAQSRPVPVTGAWTLTLQSEQGTGTPSATFEQRGQALTGRFSSAIFGEADLKGTVTGASIVFTVFTEWQGAKEEMSFKGDYDGSRSIKGTYSNSFGHGTFAAARK